MERRLIDANALAKWLDKNHHVDRPTGKCDERQNRVLGIAISALKNPQIAPTIDAVEVVRCRECERYKKFSDGSPFIGTCELAKYYIGERGYCVFGKRREPDAKRYDP